MSLPTCGLTTDFPVWSWVAVPSSVKKISHVHYGDIHNSQATELASKLTKERKDRCGTRTQESLTQSQRRIKFCPSQETDGTKGSWYVKARPKETNIIGFSSTVGSWANKTKLIKNKKTTEGGTRDWEGKNRKGIKNSSRRGGNRHNTSPLVWTCSHVVS